jgi:hypothetical protein
MPSVQSTTTVGPGVAVERGSEQADDALEQHGDVRSRARHRRAGLS